MRWLLVISILCASIFVGCKREVPVPATQPATQAAAAPAEEPTELTYVDVIRASYPNFPATQPLGIPVDLKDAGHYLLPEPIYLDPRGDLWITRPDAPPTADVLAQAPDEQIHLTRERVQFAHWTVDEEDKPLIRLVVRDADGKEAWLINEQPTPLKASGYRWKRATFYGNDIVVPSARGVSVFTFAPQPTENYQEIVPEGSAPPQVLLDPRGVLAWSPWGGGQPGGEGAWRLVEGKWTDLKSDPNWAHKFVHLVPLLDGSVLQIIDQDGKVRVALSTVEAPSLDEAVVTQLIEQLSDDDPDKREAAYAELTRYGPASWPILEKQIEDQPPEARIRMEQLLQNRITPTLGGRSLVQPIARVAARFDDGGVLLFADGGVSIPREDKPPEIIKQAWISLRPGRAIELLESVLVKDAKPDKHRVFAFDNEWIITDSVRGPQRLFGNHLEAMLGKDEAAFVHVIGYDRRGRWLFKKSPDAKETLIVDPTLPDPSPKLPVWLVHISNGQSGWSSDNWPALRRGGAWKLMENGWVPIDEKKEKFETGSIVRPPGGRVGPVAVVAPVAGGPRTGALTKRVSTTSTTSDSSTRPSTRVATTIPAPPPPPATTQAASTTPATTQDGAERLLLTDREGRRYYDGRQQLVVVDQSGKQVVWTLPGNAASDSRLVPVLIETPDGILFLFNASGRVVRIKPTPDGPQPFEVEAVFTHQIPTSDQIRRIWLDPAGRIIIAFDVSRLAILFPAGRIPPQIATLMLAGDVEQKP